MGSYIIKVTAPYSNVYEENKIRYALDDNSTKNTGRKKKSQHTQPALLSDKKQIKSV
jgi:uncharacterized protein YaiI (UPF0178 family)